MIKYVNPNTIQENGKCPNVGEGTNAERYKSFGMVEKDIEKSEIDNCWYLKDKCPHYTPEEIAEQEQIEKDKQEQQAAAEYLAELKDLYQSALLMGNDEWCAEIQAEYQSIVNGE